MDPIPDVVLKNKHFFIHILHINLHNKNKKVRFCFFEMLNFDAPSASGLWNNKFYVFELKIKRSVLTLLPCGSIFANHLNLYYKINHKKLSLNDSFCTHQNSHIGLGASLS